jgi:hypothetical protein
MSGPRVLLMRLSIRESARGTEYLTGYLGLSRMVAFKSREPDKFGNEQWELFVSEPEPKDGQRRDLPTRGSTTWSAPGQEVLPPERTTLHRNERRDPRQDHVDELAARFRPDEEIPF